MICTRLIVTLFILSCFSFAYAEMVYLKDGQVIQGKITAESQNDITVQTKFQNRRIPRSEIIRIMYGERKMEKIYLLMNDGTTQSGFLVDQDASQVILRDKEGSPQERTVSKTLIKQMSASGEIVPLSPSISIRSGVFYPLNSQGAKLKPTASFFAGSDFNFQYIKNMRLIAEAGFARNKSKIKGVYMQFIPIQAGALYDISFGNFHIMPKLSLGSCIIDFNDGEGGNERSFSFSTFAGNGLVYEIVQRHFYFSLWTEYSLLRDKTSNLHSALVTAGLSYRF